MLPGVVVGLQRPHDWAGGIANNPTNATFHKQGLAGLNRGHAGDLLNCVILKGGKGSHQVPRPAHVKTAWPLIGGRPRPVIVEPFPDGSPIWFPPSRL